MAIKAPQINYEVYYLQDGRWNLQSRFDHTEKHLAVKEGKELAKLDHYAAIKVIKEKYNREDGTSSETTVYRHSKGQIELAGPKKGRGVVIPEKKKSNKARGVVLPDGGKSDPLVNGSIKGTAKSDQEIWEENKKSTIGLVPKIILIVLLSVVLAALFTGIGSMALSKFSLFAGIMKQETAGSVLFSLFVVGFLVSCVALFYSFVSKEDMRRTVEKVEAPPRKAVAEDLPAQETTPSGVLSEDEKKAAQKSENEEKPDAPPSDQVATAATSAPQSSTEGLTGTVSLSGLEGGAAGSATIGQSLNHQLTMMTFLSRGVARLKEENIPLEKFNKFGISLFIAGAAETYKERNNLSHLKFTSLLRDTIATLGTSKGMAETFAEKYDTYLVEDSRYMEIFRLGRQAMTALIDKQEMPGEILLSAIHHWNKPKDEKGGKEPITVVFTDIVGSTDITQTLGDQAAQNVVRAHNDIVRECLTVHNGKEIKHTGDGIMASFSSGSEAIRATMEMQQNILNQIGVNPELPLKVRIGLNTGELIMEENDLFGTTVQLAARICDKADAGEIYCSGATKAICLNSPDLFFDEQDKVELKGFKEPIPLFKVVWHEDELTQLKAERAEKEETATDEEKQEAQATEEPETESASPENIEETDGETAPKEQTLEDTDSPETEAPQDDDTETAVSLDEDDPSDGSEELFDDEPEFDLPPLKKTPSDTDS